jgi:hypothetical protein
MSSFRHIILRKRPPAGWSDIEETLMFYEEKLREAVAEDHEKKRRAEITWQIHRLHWEKNRYIFHMFVCSSSSRARCESALMRCPVPPVCSAGISATTRSARSSTTIW